MARPKTYTWQDAAAAFFNDDRGYVLLSTEEEYKNCDSKLRYQCPAHPNKELAITFSHFKEGKGCPYCAGTKVDWEDIVDAFNNDSRGYILLSDRTDYKNNKSHLKYRCPNHPDKILTVRWDNYKTGTNCPYCSQVVIDWEDIVKAFQQDSRGYILLSTQNDYINNNSKLRYQCPKHPSQNLSITWSNYQKGQGCPLCGVGRSTGEEKINHWLLQNCSQDFTNTVDVDIQKTFPDLKDNRKLSYDFYLDKYNLLIEYQGNFHDGSGPANKLQSSQALKKQQYHDQLKREYAKQHNIRLLEIWYWDYDNIEDILYKTIIEGRLNNECK